MASVSRLKWGMLGLVGAVSVMLPVAQSSAATVELGASRTPIVPPTCPAGVAPTNCKIVLTQATALQTVTDYRANPTVAKRSGRVLSFRVGLSDLSPTSSTRTTDITYLDRTYGGAPRVIVTILRHEGPARWRVVARSRAFNITARLGTVATLELGAGLAISAGEAVALTTPTWAPVLDFDLPASQFGYAQSRSRDCDGPPVDAAQVSVDSETRYGCRYVGTRVEYSAREALSQIVVSVPAFKMRFTAQTIANHRRELDLLQLVIKPAIPGEHLTGGCAHCAGGTLRHSQLEHSEIVVKVRPAAIVTDASVLFIGLSARGRKGRFKLYDVSIAPFRLIPTEEACTPPGEALDPNRLATLRKVSCA